MPETRPPAQHPRRRWPRRLALGVAAAVGFVVLILAVAIGVLIADPSVVASQVKSQALPRLSELLGRQVTVSTVEVHLFPPRASLGGLRIGGRPGEPAFAEVSQARAALRLWPLLRSRGREVQLRSIELEAPRINLVRARDGSWNVPEMESEPSQREVVISSLEIADGELHVVDRAAGGSSQAVALRRINLRAEHLGDLEREATAALTASLAAEDPNLRLDARLPPGGEGARGEFSLDGLDLARMRSALPSGLGSTVTGGRLALRGTFARTQGAYEVKGQLNAPHVALRSQSASGALAFLARVPDAGAATVDLSRITLKGPGIDLGGNATLKSAPLAATFALSGPLLDLDALLAALPPQQARPAPPEDGGALPESMRRQVAGLTARGQLAVDRMVARKVAMQGVVADARLARGIFVFEKATAALYGGRMDVTGTRIDLTRPVPTWELHGDLKEVQLGQAMQQTTGASPLRGVLNGRLDLAGTGDLWAQLRTNLTGKGRIVLEDGALTSADLGGSIAAQVDQALRQVGRAGRGQGGTGRGPLQTTLDEVGGSFTVENGWVRFARPIAVETDFGRMRLEGGIGLDQRLSLRGRAQLSPQFVAGIAGKAPPKPVDVPLQIGGTLAEPVVQIDSAGVVRGLLGQTPLPQGPEDLRKKLEDRTRGLFGTP